MPRRLGALARTGAHVAGAPLAIVVGIDRTPIVVSDASRAIQSMLLTAWADGLGANWVGFGDLSPINPLLDIPDDVAVFAILPIGYPNAVLGRGKKARKSLAEVAHRERFGQSFE